MQVNNTFNSSYLSDVYVFSFIRDTVYKQIKVQLMHANLFYYKVPVSLASFTNVFLGLHKYLRVRKRSVASLS